MLTIQEFLQELDQETHATRRVLERIPDDRLDWQPHAKSMTLGQLGMHVANLPGAIAEVSTRDFDVKTVIPRPGAESTAQLLGVLEDSVKRAKTIIGAMADADLTSRWRMVNGEHEVRSMTRGEL